MVRAWRIRRWVGGMVLLAALAGRAEPVELDIPLLLAGPAARRAVREAERDIRDRTGERLIVNLVTGQKQAVPCEAALLTDAQREQVGKIHAVYLLPGLFMSSEQTGALQPFMMQDLQAHLAQSGLTLLGIEQGGAARLMSTTRVVQPSDLRGRKLWMPTLNHEDDGLKNLTAHWGTETVSVEPREVPDALRSGKIDLTLVPVATAIALRWHHELTYVLDLPFLYLSRPIVTPNTKVASLSPHDLEALTSVLARLLATLREDSERLDARSLRVLQLQKIEIVETDEAARAMWQRWFNDLAQHMIDDGSLDAQRLEKIKDALAKTPRIRED